MNRGMFTGRTLVAFAPCGCWFAVLAEMTDPVERAAATSEFLADQKRNGNIRFEDIRFEDMTHEQWRALRNGIGNNLEVGCDHEPKWGGGEPTHGECRRCRKSVKLRKDGKLVEHRTSSGFGVCSQEPWQRGNSAGNPDR